MVNESSDMLKMWIVLYVYGSSREMVLGLVSNLNYVVFLCIKFEPMYFSERCPDNIILGNGTNFKAEDTQTYV